MKILEKIKKLTKKMKILPKTNNFNKKSKFQQKIKILPKTKNFNKKLKFEQKNENFNNKNENFNKKMKILTKKMKILEKNLHSPWQILVAPLKNDGSIFSKSNKVVSKFSKSPIE